MASEWFYTRDGKTKIGPVSSAQLQALANSGQLLPTDLVWKEGMARWTAASNINGLFSWAADPAPTSKQPQAPQPVAATAPVQGRKPHDPLHVLATGRPARWARRVWATVLGGLAVAGLSLCVCVSPILCVGPFALWRGQGAAQQDAKPGAADLTADDVIAASTDAERAKGLAEKPFVVVGEAGGPPALFPRFKAQGVPIGDLHNHIQGQILSGPANDPGQVVITINGKNTGERFISVMFFRPPDRPFSPSFLSRCMTINPGDRVRVRATFDTVEWGITRLIGEELLP
jgi:hypothetical protein